MPRTRFDDHVLPRFDLRWVHAGAGAALAVWYGPDRTQPMSQHSVDGAALERLVDQLPLRAPQTPRDRQWLDDLAKSPLLNPTGERELMADLGELLLPHELRTVLLRLPWGGRARLGILTDGLLTYVPWGSLVVGGRGAGSDTRLVEVADVFMTQSAGLAGTRPAPLALRDGAPCYVVDPHTGELPPILDRKGRSLWRERIRAVGGTTPVGVHRSAAHRSHIARATLSAALVAGPSRLTFVGHVQDNPHGGHDALVLSDPAGTNGHGHERGGSIKPLAALDLWLGEDNRSGHTIWPMPERVLLYGCSSGTDNADRESVGLVTTVLHNGADLVTATRWPLPTDRAFTRLNGAARLAGPPGPFTEAALQLDAAHHGGVDISDVVHRCSDLHRIAIRRWRRGGRPTDSTLLWGAFGHNVSDALV